MSIRKQFNFIRILAFALLFTAVISAVYSQDFSRTIELKNPRMNGQDVLCLQNRLLALGFSGIGDADGWYGPLSEGAYSVLAGVFMPQPLLEIIEYGSCPRLPSVLPVRQNADSAELE